MSGYITISGQFRQSLGKNFTGARRIVTKEAPKPARGVEELFRHRALPGGYVHRL